jgi:hypothetical protein
MIFNLHPISNLNLFPKGKFFHIFHYIKLKMLVNFQASEGWLFTIYKLGSV